MNKESIEIINSYIKPDRELVAKVKKVNSVPSRNNIMLKTAIAVCTVFLIVLSVSLFGNKSDIIIDKSTKPDDKTVQQTTNNNGIYQYSELVDVKSGLDESLVGYDISSFSDMSIFSEALLNVDCIAIVEATVKDVWLKEYVVVSEFDKFVDNGTITNKFDSIVCEIKIDKVWYGDIEENQTIIVENRLFLFDEAICIKEGHKYILPICDSGEDIAELSGTGDIISGDITRESNLGIVYYMQPQIELVNGGYVFNSLWETLVCDECIKIEMDMELSVETEFYRDKMMFLTTEIFNDRFQIIVDNLSAND